MFTTDAETQDRWSLSEFGADGVGCGASLGGCCKTTNGKDNSNGCCQSQTNGCCQNGEGGRKHSSDFFKVWFIW